MSAATLASAAGAASHDETYPSGPRTRAVGPLRRTWQGIRARLADAVRSASSSVTPHAARSAPVAKGIECSESIAHSTLTKGTSGLPNGTAAGPPAPAVVIIAFAQV